MRFKDVFSIIGPGMIGPSSSHTAGAVRLGRTARRIFGSLPAEAEIVFYGSFAETYAGHGTDLAIVAGLLDCNTDDPRIRHSLDLAETEGMKVSFRKGSLPSAHPNTALMILKGGQGEEDRIEGISIGGGNIEITGVNGFDVRFSAQYPSVLIFHDDLPGMLAEFTRVISESRVNIGSMDVDRKSRSGEALTVIEMDESNAAGMAERISGLPNVRRISFLDLTSEEVN
jgi:L-serine dehydratase